MLLVKYQYRLFIFINYYSKQSNACQKVPQEFFELPFYCFQYSENLPIIYFFNLLCRILGSKNSILGYNLIRSAEHIMIPEKRVYCFSYTRLYRHIFARTRTYFNCNNFGLTYLIKIVLDTLYYILLPFPQGFNRYLQLI